MNILKQGKYPENNRIVCKECGCEFQYYNSEVITETSSIQEQEMLGGYSIRKYINCPNCKTNCEIYFKYYEDTYISFFTEIKEWFKNKFRKDK